MHYSFVLGWTHGCTTLRMHPNQKCTIDIEFLEFVGQWEYKEMTSCVVGLWVYGCRWSVTVAFYYVASTTENCKIYWYLREREMERKSYAIRWQPFRLVMRGQISIYWLFKTRDLWFCGGRRLMCAQDEFTSTRIPKLARPLCRVIIAVTTNLLWVANFERATVQGIKN